MLTLNDAQELVKKPESARELAAAMIPDKISVILEKKIDTELINAIALSKSKVWFCLAGYKVRDTDLVAYLHLLGLKSPKVEVKQYSCCGSLESDPFVEFALHEHFDESIPDR
jgi:hypothetical protein